MQPHQLGACVLQTLYEQYGLLTVHVPMHTPFRLMALLRIPRPDL